jgi:hypothetical protein
MSTVEEPLGRKTSDSGLENREYDGRDPSRWPRWTLCPQTLALTSPKKGARSVGTVRSRTRTTEFVCFKDPRMAVRLRPPFTRQTFFCFWYLFLLQQAWATFPSLGPKLSFCLQVKGRTKLLN